VIAVTNLFLTVLICDSDVTPSSASALSSTTVLEEAITSLKRFLTTMGITLSPLPEDITPFVSLAHTYIHQVVDDTTSLSNISTSPSFIPSITDTTTTAKRQQPKKKDTLDALQNAALALLPTPTTLEGSALAVVAMLTTLSMLNPRSDGGEEETPRAAGITLATVASQRWNDEEAAGMELAERMLMALLTIASSNDGADGEVAVGMNL